MNDRLHRRSNDCIALQAIGASMRSLVGPNKSLKCYVTDSHPGQENALMGDAMQVLDALAARTEHPVGALLHDACLTHHKAYGTGVTTLVTMTCLWAREMLPLTEEEGAPPEVVFALFEEVLVICNDVFRTIGISMDTLETPCGSAVQRVGVKGQERESSPFMVKKMNVLGGGGGRYVGEELGGHVTYGASSAQRARVLSFSRHFTASGSQVEHRPVQMALPARRGPRLQVQKQPTSCQMLHLLGPRLAHGREEAMQLAVKALEVQAQESTNCHLSPRFVLIQSLLGQSRSESRVLSGAAVVRLDPSMVGAVRSLAAPTKMLLVNGDATPAFAHAGLRSKDSDVMLHHQLRSHDILEEEWSRFDALWVESCAQVFEKYRIGFLVVGGAVSTLLWEHCLSHGVVVVKHLPQHHSSLLTLLAGAEPVTYITQCKDRHVSAEVTVDVLDNGGRRRGGQRKYRGTKTHFCVVKPSHPSPPPITSVILCERTNDSLAILENQFSNCLHRLTSAIRDPCLLPGGGVAEAACIRELQTRLNLDKSDSLPPFTMATNWMVDVLREWRARVYHSFMASLRDFVTFVLRNVQPGLGLYEAHSTVEGMVADTKGGERRSEVLDVRESKYEGWQKAYQTARLTLQLSQP